MTEAATCAAAGSKTSIIVDDNKLLTRLPLSHLPSPNHNTHMQGSIKESKRWWHGGAEREAHTSCHYPCCHSCIRGCLPPKGCLWFGKRSRHRREALVVWRYRATRKAVAHATSACE